MFLLIITLPQQATSSETDPTKLLASLNSKTKVIKYKDERENKIRKITTREETVNSYVFSLDQQKLKIEFKKEVRTFQNGKHTETDTVSGTISLSPDQLDRETTQNYANPIDLVCLGRKNCINVERQYTNYLVETEKKTEDIDKKPTFMFQLRAGDQSLAKQIHQELKELLALLAPQDKAAEDKKAVEQPATEPVAKK
jgi:hypothetical protein